MAAIFVQVIHFVCGHVFRLRYGPVTAAEPGDVLYCFGCQAEQVVAETQVELADLGDFLNPPPAK